MPALRRSLCKMMPICKPAWSAIRGNAYIPIGIKLLLKFLGCSQANNSIFIIQQNIDFPQRLGTIFYNSISQNQSYGVAGKPSSNLRHRPHEISKSASFINALT